MQSSENDTLIVDTRAWGEKSEFTLDLASIDPQQIPYLEMLSKYSPRRNKIKIISSSDIPQRKLVYVRENMGYLSIDDQVSFNDADIALKTDRYYSYFVGGGAALLMFGYYIVKTPLTRNLLKEVFKSLGVGALAGYGYYRWSYENYLTKLHKYYVQIINEKRARRLKRGEIEDQL